MLKRFFQKTIKNEASKSDELTDFIRKTSKLEKKEIMKRLVKRFFFLKKQQKKFEAGRTHQFRSSSTSNFETRNLKEK